MISLDEAWRIDLAGDRFRDQVLGCWIGKNCGGTLGAPWERGWGVETPFEVTGYTNLPESGGLPNDDLELQLVWLLALEQVGPGLKARDLVRFWMRHVAYNWDEYGLAKTNMRLGLLPPATGSHANWFVDCMGSPIRSEIWACISPGSPARAVSYAFEDAICDHAGGEGVAGEIYNAAVQAASFVVDDPQTLIAIGLSYLPDESMTAIAIRTVVMQDGRFEVTAGAGVVADSVPELEALETRNKARAALSAISAARRR